jgi:hypothetical protein
MRAPTLAQRILIALGVDPQKVLMGHLVGKSKSHTKKGPGRTHAQGKEATNV